MNPRLDKFSILANTLGFRIEDVPYDGNCMLSAIGYYINMSGVGLRNYLIKYCENNILPIDNIFKFDINFIQKLKNKEWCDEETLQLIVYIFRKNICILNEKTESLITIISPCINDDIIYIGYLFNYHYVILHKY